MRRFVNSRLIASAPAPRVTGPGASPLGRRVLRCAALATLAAAAGACQCAQPPAGPASGPDLVTGSQPKLIAPPPVEPGGREELPPRPEPIEPGNFAILTVPGASGRAEALQIESCQVEVRIVDRLARTTVTQVFRNHLSRETEGSYELVLPEGAAISRLAMDVDGKLMEGELVEREKARQIYESIVQRQKDPALLEWQGGTRFTTSIFPIPPRGTKTVILAYEQLLPRRAGELSYRYELPAMIELTGQTAAGPSAGRAGLFGRFSFQLEAAGSGVPRLLRYDFPVEPAPDGGQLRFERAPFTPSGPIELRFAAPQVDETRLWWAALEQQERFFLLDLTPRLPERRAGGPAGVVLALDTSASVGQRELQRAVELALGLLARLPAGVRYQIVTGDLNAALCTGPGGVTPDLGPARACLVEGRSGRAGLAASGALGLSAGGATDLEGLLRLAASTAAAMGTRADVVLFGDGTPSLGELDGDLIRAGLLKALGPSRALHAVAVGVAPNEDFLASLARPAGGHSLRLRPNVDLEELGATLAGLLAEPLLADLKVEIKSGEVAGLSPGAPVNLARGESLAILGQLVSPTATLTLSGRHGDSAWRREVKLAAPPDAPPDRLLRNFWARALIEQQQAGTVDRQAVVATSLRYGVMSRYTSFLVLENDEAYKRFEIERRKEQEAQAAQAQAAQAAARQAEQQAQATKVLTKSKADLKDVLQQASQAAEPAPAGGEALAGAPAPAAPMVSLSDRPAPRAPSRASAGPPMSAPPASASEAADYEMMAKEEADDEAPAKKSLSREKRKAGFGRVKDSDAVEAPPAPSPPDHQALVRGLLARRAELALYEVSKLLNLLILVGREDEARTLTSDLLATTDGTPAEQAVARGLSDDQRLEALRHVSTTGEWLGDARLTLIARLLAAGERSLDLLRQAHDAAVSPAQRLRAAQLLIGQCDPLAYGVDACIGLLQQLAEQPGVAARVAQLEESRLDLLIQQRRQDMGNVELIDQYVALLQQRGQRERALRALSEIVEFAPQEYGARVAYAQRLTQHEDVLGGCAQYAAAVQLNPAQRDTFRTMMGLRRQYQQHAEALKRCIVDGVSKLPVQRDISLIMTWEDDNADVDLHIHEAGGEEVFYSRRESQQGGLLYYDITDGYGPEIYVLGTAPKGVYRLTVVYYRGSRSNVPVTVTVLRNAGAPNETRQVIDLKLPTANSSVQLPITELRF